MIKITKLKECDKISSPIYGYIKMKLKQMIEEYSVDSISDFSAVLKTIMIWDLIIQFQSLFQSI